MGIANVYAFDVEKAPRKTAAPVETSTAVVVVFSRHCSFCSDTRKYACFEERTRQAGYTHPRSLHASATLVTETIYAASRM